MCIYEPIQDADGALFLSAAQRFELRAKGHSSERIFRALLNLYELSREKSSRAGGNLPPCSACGGINFIPTGNCHACATCGDSQGCS